ncbi:hypothetical protein B0H16DRAFT_1718671 [Mycena metata]|uniref:Uncharacterized protein n=1 Tax=Mycena metata TaxID=1033252 RepID=A0AAD7JEW9_9AGAR|nr:hypothetical protein B0H16DRAFT_1718671 [Mycena metata]
MQNSETLGELRTEGTERGKIKLVEDLWGLLSEYNEPRKLPRENLYELQFITPLWRDLYRPIIYERINLRSYRDAEILFFYTLPQKEFLQHHIMFLSFGFVIPLKDTPESPLWVAIRAMLPRLLNLHTLIMAFTHVDPEPLGRVYTHVLRDVALPDGLCNLHLRSSPEHLDHEKKLHSRPWEDNVWRLHVSQIPPPIQEFIFTTPHYIVWPPTKTELEKLGRSWTAQFKRRRGVKQPLSTLTCFTIHNGYIEDGADDSRLAEFSDTVFKLNGFGRKNQEERLDESMGHTEVPMEGTRGIRLRWAKVEAPENHPRLGGVPPPDNVGEWVQEEEAWEGHRMHFEMFGGEGEEWKLGWLQAGVPGVDIVSATGVLTE